MLFKQGYVALRLKSSLKNFYCWHYELVDRYLRTIYFSDGNGSVLFQVDMFVFIIDKTFTELDCMSKTADDL
jgi:hypothetical protein